MSTRRTLRTAAAGLLTVALLGAVLGPGRMLWALYHPPQQDLPLPPDLISLQSAEGQRLLSASPSVDFTTLQVSFQPQQYGSYCGVASSVIALGALGVPVTQDDFFTDEAEVVRQQRAVLFGGMTLADLRGLLAAHGVQATAHHAGEGDLADFRQQAADNLARPGDVVLVNYHRPALAQEGGGHISPLAAYEAGSNRFLILDTASYRYPPVWVSADDLWAAMDTIDSDSGQTRGFVLISP